MAPISQDDLTLLFTFFDAIRAGEACRHLEAAAIPFQVEDRGTPNQGLNDWNNSPSVWLDVSVSPHHLVTARNLLQNSMHLFPDRETPLSQPTSDDEEDANVAVAFCETEEEAAQLSTLLGCSGIASRIILPEDPEETLIAIEVRGADAEQASLALEKWSA